MVRKLLAAVCGLLRGGDAPAEDGVRTSPSPINGVATEVRFVMRHPQFEADIVEALEGGLQWTDPNPSPAQLAALYDEDYNKAYGRDLSASAVIPPFVERRAAAQCSFVAERLPEGTAPIASVVEVGGGWGALSSAIMAFGAPFPPEVACFELDSEAVAFMRGRGVDGRGGTLEASDVEPGSVDLVVSSMMLEHVLDPAAALGAWRSKLRTGGHLFVEVPLENPAPTWWGTDPAKPYWVGHLTFFKRAHVAEMLAAAGFAVIAEDGFDGPVAPNYVNAGDAPYDVASVPVAQDTAPSEGAHPRLLRVLAVAV